MAGLNPLQVQVFAVRPALEQLGKWSAGAEALVMGTAAQESQFTYLHQLGKGPAVGLWQMEPATFNDHMHWLDYHTDLRSAILKMSAGYPEVTQLAWNLRLGAAMCRVHYLRSSMPIPSADDIPALAHIYKIVYNSPLGAATEEQFIRNYNLYLRGAKA